MSNAKLEIEGKTIELPIIKGSENEVGLDISKLRAETGVITVDDGFVNTGSCESSITFINGGEGILRYRGYGIEELAEKSNFEEVAYLLINGELPTSAQLSGFKAKIAEYSTIPVEVKNIISSFPPEAHPMAVVSSAMVALSAFYPELQKGTLTEADTEKVIPLVMGAMKVIAAANYRHSKGKTTGTPNGKYNYAQDFTNLMFDKVDDDIARALDVLFILHADHEQNCSASTVRVVGSSRANLFASVSAGINALWGPLHGGANQKVIEMLDAIQNDGGDYKKWLGKAKDKSDPFRLMGFGHRVYKNFDPRAKIIKKACDTILNKLGVQDPILDIAKGLEEQALSDEYFVERKLYPNVDFYSGIIYRALGIPTHMFTVMFALGRLPGWVSQWKEMIESPNLKICRPRQIYTGSKLRSYTGIESR